ncbi:Ferredoxin-NADP reductase [Roseivivax halotolerans]|jgi:ferredoxin-NADP reductase|uniref:Ferredoxin-NADP reductase n=1 Tax=Roseivivax halotolerans TaxID=93684 RepID=A0A1I5ZTJ3_9RHOB|nr:MULTISPECIES: hybrid-cluster NAD(P)-dependent oxidoreductase [Roseivivax]QFT62135.1 3-ketosteroid-9-alpha-hydroxylase reductase subunit [Roseivivax sp. THAF30]SFQ59799.1 Ferredoxin-NADP reductase [Roseivivax halotolerans]
MSEYWTDTEELICTMVVPEAPNVKTFAFRAASGKPFRYKPGQFITLEVPVKGGPIHRTYTLSSTPSRPLTISVTIKCQPDSIGTRWMFDNLGPGMKMRAFGPAGHFTLDDPEKKFLFIAAGSGITPMMSMASYLYDKGDMPDARLVACARRPSELIFRQRLIHMASRVPGLHLSFAVTEEEPYEVWTGYLGRFNQLMLGLMAPDYLEREVYCCGPEDFMTMVREGLAGLGFDMDHYHQESFEAPVAKAEDVPEFDDTVPQDATEAEVVFSKSGLHVSCHETDTVLSLSRANGLRIPSGCTFGICGTCKIRKTAGEVHMVHNGGISEEDIEEGYILACCSHPIGKVEVDA